MAGLSAAARVRELGAEPLVLEKGDRPGGSMLLSSGVVWRYRTLEDFRAECPGGDPALQRQIIGRLDEGIAWLESLGARVVARATGNPRTVGMRFGPRGLSDALVRAAGQVHFGHDLVPGTGTGPEVPVVLATGGFPVRLARERGLLLRANRWSEGDGLDLARTRGAATAGDLEEFYGRAMPAPLPDIREGDFVRLAQLYGRFATVTSEDGRERFAGDPDWSETDLVQEIARWPGGRAWYTVDDASMRQRVRGQAVEQMIDAARAAGATIRVDPPRVSVLVQASVTQTLGGLAIDERARVLGEDGSPIEGLFAAGADVGGISNGGWSSGLAAALVFGRIAAEQALS
jgi:succinate dehydrogenase/fumarate reductase flavoprotein subunit